MVEYLEAGNAVRLRILRVYNSKKEVFDFSKPRLKINSGKGAYQMAIKKMGRENKTGTFIPALNTSDKTIHAEYTAVVKQQGDWWVGWIEELPGVNCQERTHRELIETLKITLKETIEFNRHDAIASAGSGYTEEKIAVAG